MNGYSELLLTMGALIIFGLYAMQANSSMGLSNTLSIENETQLEAVKIAETIIHQAAALPFDRVLFSGPLKDNNQSNLTDSRFFGVDGSGNSLSGPKDQRPVALVFDDFHGHVFTEAGIFGEYKVETSVRYIRSDGANTGVGEKRLRKKLTVVISHPNLNSDITMRYIKSYH